jgi:hypothetical protein
MHGWWLAGCWLRAHMMGVDEEAAKTGWLAVVVRARGWWWGVALLLLGMILFYLNLSFGYEISLTFDS